MFLALGADASYGLPCVDFFLLSAFEPHTNPRCFIVLHEHLFLLLDLCFWAFPGLIWCYTFGPKDLKLHQKELKKENSWKGRYYIYIYVHKSLYMCVYLPLPKGLESLLCSWSFKDCLRMFGTCKKQHGSEEKTWIQGVTPLNN